MALKVTVLSSQASAAGWDQTRWTTTHEAETFRSTAAGREPGPQLASMVSSAMDWRDLSLSRFRPDPQEGKLSSV
jgi:hypothetical protein